MGGMIKVYELQGRTRVLATIGVMPALLLASLDQTIRAIATQVGALRLPMQFKLNTGGSTSPQSLFDPTRLTAIRAGLPAQAQSLFDQVMTAIRIGLADTLHDLFRFSAAIVAVSRVASLFLREVPIRSAREPAFGEVPTEEAPGEATA